RAPSAPRATARARLRPWPSCPPSCPGVTGEAYESARQGEAMGDRGGLAAVRRVELAEDVLDVDARRLDADHELGGDLAVRVAAGDEAQHLGLAPGQAEQPLGTGLAFERVGRRRELETRALREQLELAQERLRPEPARDGVRLPERRARGAARGARRDERLHLAPAAVGRERGTLEPLPERRRLRPRVGSSLAADAEVLGLRL